MLKSPATMSRPPVLDRTRTSMCSSCLRLVCRPCPHFLPSRSTVRAYRPTIVPQRAPSMKMSAASMVPGHSSSTRGPPWLTHSISRISTPRAAITVPHRRPGPIPLGAQRAVQPAGNPVGGTLDSVSTTTDGCTCSPSQSQSSGRGRFGATACFMFHVAILRDCSVLMSCGCPDPNRDPVVKLTLLAGLVGTAHFGGSVDSSGHEQPWQGFSAPKVRISIGARSLKANTPAMVATRISTR